MRKLVFCLFTFSVVTGVPAKTLAEDSAQAIIDKAIAAQGGAENLAKFKAFAVTSKGTMDIKGKNEPCIAESYVQFPDQFKTTLEFTNNGKRLTQVVNKDKVAITLDGKPQRLDDATRKEIKEHTRAEVLVNLIALKDSQYKLTVLGESAVGDRQAVGVKISSEGHNNVTLHFDKESGFLVKVEQKLTDPKQGAFTQAVVYSDYKDFNGVKRPTRQTIYKDGTKVMTMEVVEFKNLEKLPDNVFEP
jgi:outer membrane lipoprotein-sorting protein